MGYVRWFAVWAALVASGHARAVGGLADVSIVDCDTGVTLTPHYYHGEYWIAGTPGARYAIEIRSRAPGRLLAVTSVDGINVISGETAGWEQSGYVFDRGARYRITGWRKSDAEVAAFTFTALPDSYAALTGRPANVGVIGVAMFRERPPAVVSSLSESEALRRQSPAASGAGEARAEAAAPVSPKLGTGHGEREYSYVSHTDFQRMQEEPNEVIHLRYDSLQNLIAMGVIKGPRPVPPGADPFPASPGQYVPDPPS